MATSLSKDDILASIPNAQDFEVQELTSKGGDKYWVGSPKGSAEAEKKGIKPNKPKDEVKPGEIRAMAHGGELHQPVDPNWEVDTRGNTEEWFRGKTGISYYDLSTVRDIPIVGKLVKLDFQTDQTYNYYFQDRTGQWTQCNVWLTGSHWVTWTSTDGAVKQVDGY